MSEQTVATLKKWGALAILVVATALLIMCWFFLDKRASAATPSANAEGGGNVSKMFASDAGRPSVKDAFGLSATQNLGGGGDEHVFSAITGGDSIFVIGTTDSSDGDFAAKGINIFIAKLNFSLDLVSCVTFEETDNVEYLDSAAASDGIAVLCRTSGGTFVYGVNARMDAHVKTPLSLDLDRLYYDAPTGSLYALSGGGRLSIVKLDRKLEIARKQFIELSNVRIAAITPSRAVKDGIDLYVGAADGTHLVSTDGAERIVKKLGVNGAAFYGAPYLRNYEKFVALLSKDKISVVSPDFSIYNEAPVEAADAIVRAGDCLAAVSVSPAEAQWLCNCGCSVLTKETLPVNMTAAPRKLTLGDNDALIAETQKPRCGKTFSLLAFKNMKTEIYAYKEDTLCDILPRSAISDGDDVIVLLETVAASDEFSQNRGGRDAFLIRLKSPFAA